MTSRAPIAVFAYNRCDHFKRMFASLQSCSGFAESAVTIFIDGPRSQDDAAAVGEVKAYAQSLNLPNVRIVERSENLGLKQSIYAGVTEICQQQGRVIVFEDDLLLSPAILDYFNDGLDRYADNPNVWTLVGYQYDVPALRSCPRALVLPFTHTWGWATWGRAWLGYDMNAPVDPKDLSSASFRRAYDVFGVRDFRNMLVLALESLVSCWFSPWYYKMFKARGVSLFPPQTYIAHVGYDGGTHASRLNPYNMLVKPTPPSAAVFAWPETLSIDYWAIDAIATSWDARVQKYISYLGHIKRMLRRK